MRRKKHIVFLLGSYYPHFSAVGRCMGNVIEALERDDVQITILCFYTATTQSPTECIGNQQIIHINKQNAVIKERFYSDASRTVLGKNLNHIGRNLFRIQQVVRICFAKTTCDSKLQVEYLKHLETLGAIDLLIPCNRPIESIRASVDYHLKHLQTKLAPFLFDAYSESITEHRLLINKILKFKAHLRVEQEFLKNSERVIFVESWKKHLEYYFPEFSNKFVMIEHPLLKELKTAHQSLLFDKTKVNIVYTGGLDLKMRPPQYTLKLFSGLLQKRSDIILHFFAMGNAMYLIKKYVELFPGRIFNHGSVPTETAYKAMTEADILLSIGATNVPQLSSKIFEYMSAGKPIIQLSVNERDVAISILAKYQAACCLLQKNELLEFNIEKIQKFINQHREDKINFQELSKTFSNALPSYSADVIRSILYQKK